MSSSPASPVTPSRRRHGQRLSNLDTSQESATSNTTNGTSLSRRSSRTSQTSYPPTSPITPRPVSSRSARQDFSHRRRTSRASVSSSISLGDNGANGLGSLADELGEVWEHDDVEGPGSSFLDGLREGSVDPPDTSQTYSPSGTHDIHDFGYAMTIQSLSRPRSFSQRSTLSPCVPSIVATKSQGFKHERSESQYDGSDYGPESDGEDFSDFSPSLARRIRETEKVVRMSTNTEDSLSEGGGVVVRTTQALRDLGPQSSIENGASRLITAYTSMATHRTHKTREVFSQAHSLLYGSILSLPEELIDVLCAEIDSLINTCSASANIHPTEVNPLYTLQSLSSHTTDLVYTLRSLTDALTESRIATNTALRKLKSVREKVEEIRVENELCDESMMLIQMGDWDRRCRERQAARTCREIVAGFGQVCDVSRDEWTKGLERREREKERGREREKEKEGEKERERGAEIEESSQPASPRVIDHDANHGIDL